MPLIALFCAVLACALWCTPSPAFAEKVATRVSADTEVVSDTLTLFSLSFSLRAFNTDVYIPDTLTEGVENGARENTLGYRFEEETAVPETLTHVTGMTFLGAERTEDGLWHVPEGEQVTVVILALARSDTADAGHYRFVLTELPFYTDPGSSAEHLNPSELKYHRTDFAAVGESAATN